MKPLEIKIPSIPPSYNKEFKINYSLRQTYLSQEVRDFKNLVKRFMYPWYPPDNCHFSIYIEIHQDWFYKNHKLKKQDVQNMDKLLVDAIFERIGCDDSRVWELTIKKKQSSDRTYTWVRLEIMNCS